MYEWWSAMDNNNLESFIIFQLFIHQNFQPQTFVLPIHGMVSLVGYFINVPYPNNREQQKPQKLIKTE